MGYPIFLVIFSRRPFLGTVALFLQDIRLFILWLVLGPFAHSASRWLLLRRALRQIAAKGNLFRQSLPKHFTNPKKSTPHKGVAA